MFLYLPFIKYLQKVYIDVLIEWNIMVLLYSKIYIMIRLLMIRLFI